MRMNTEKHGRRLARTAGHLLKKQYVPMTKRAFAAAIFAVLAACGNGEVRWCWGTEEWCDQHRPGEERVAPVGVVTDVRGNYAEYVYIDNRACNLVNAEIHRDDGKPVDKSEIRRGMTAEIISMDGATDNPIAVKELLLQSPRIGTIEVLDMKKQALRIGNMEFSVNGETIFGDAMQAGLSRLSVGDEVQVYWLRGGKEKDMFGLDESRTVPAVATRIENALQDV